MLSLISLCVTASLFSQCFGYESVAELTNLNDFWNIYLNNCKIFNRLLQMTCKEHCCVAIWNWMMDGLHRLTDINTKLLLLVNHGMKVE